MRRSRKWFLLFAVVALLALNGVAITPEPVEAGALCHEGRWQDWKLHCQLGAAVNCTECWVWPE